MFCDEKLRKRDAGLGSQAFLWGSILQDLIYLRQVPQRSYHILQVKFDRLFTTMQRHRSLEAHVLPRPSELRLSDRAVTQLALNAVAHHYPAPSDLNSGCHVSDKEQQPRLTYLELLCLTWTFRQLANRPICTFMGPKFCATKIFVPPFSGSLETRS